MTVHILSAGDGYAYYTSETATGDVKREPGRELGDYYTADGNPPGVWVGSGRDGLGVAGTVSEQQMKALYGEGLHPNAERIMADARAAGKSVAEAAELARLGRPYYSYSPAGTDLSAGIEAGYARFEGTHRREPNVVERRSIRTEEGARAFLVAKGREPADAVELGRYITAATRPAPQAVAGFDLVFSPAKSVSTLWALGDNETRVAIERAHEEAIADTVGYLEREAVATRAGRNGVAQIDVVGGIIATRFRHYDSRAGDPQLHDHLVVANKVLGADGKWRTLDSKLLHRQGVAASEYYNTQVMDRVADALGVRTELREVTAGKRAVVEIAGVDGRLLAGFSTRSADIRKTLSQLERSYRADHGRYPDQAARIKLAQQATLATRPVKEHVRSLADLRDLWRSRATTAVGRRTVDGLLEAARSAGRRGAPSTSGPLDVAVAAREVVATVSEHHAVWGPHMIEAEARRYVQAARIAGVETPNGAAETITRRALEIDSVSVTPPPAHGAFAPLTRADGASIYEHKGRALYTSAGILRAEDRLLGAATTRTLAPVEVAGFERAAAAHTGALDAGQRNLAREFTTSDRLLVVGTGPAGAGKTTALALAARAAEQSGVRLLGLAPAAAAAAAFTDAVGVEAHTIHSFVRAYTVHGDATATSAHQEAMKLRPGDIVVVDEAGMAGTVNLARVVDIAVAHGAHVRLIGDSRQLDAVESGGALRLLEREVGCVHLETIHRFRNPDGTVNTAEAAATELLRDPARGDPFTWYVAEGRVTGGDLERMTGDVFAGWQADTNAGRRSVMLAAQNATVTELNARAQAFRISAGTVTGHQAVDLRDGLRAHRGDLIVTRRNDATMRTDRGRDRVKNNDLWTVTRVHRDGSLQVVHDGHGGRVTLPAGYVREHVELGYASTVHRAQGLTADTAHVLADPSTSRAMAYVAMTRGRESNRLYVETGDGQPMAEVLDQIAANTDGMRSVHESIRAEQARRDDLVTLADEYRDVTDRADATRFAVIATAAVGAATGGTLRDDEAWGVLEASLRAAEAAGRDPVVALRRVYDQGPLQGADSEPVVLAARVQADLRSMPAVADAEVGQRVPGWIVDRGALDSRHTDPVWRAHLVDRYEHLAGRLEERGAALAVDPPAWAENLGPVPSEAERRAEWSRLAAEIDTFRGRYRIDQATPEAIPVMFRDQPTGANLAARAAVLYEAAAKSPDTGRPAGSRSVAEVLREQNRADRQARAEQLRSAGITPTVTRRDPPGDRQASRDRHLRESDRTRPGDERER